MAGFALALACTAAGADDDDAVADADWGVLLLTLVLFSVGITDVGGTDVSPPNNSPMSGAERLLLRVPFFPLGAGAIITGTAGAVSFRPVPLLLLDLDFDSGVAAAGSDAARGARFGLMLRGLAIDVDASRAAAADDDAAAGGPGGSSFLLLDLAGFAEAARFDSNLDAVGVGSIFGAWSPLGTDAVLRFIASALLSFGLIGSMPAGGGGGPGGGPFALTVISSFRCADLPRCNLLIVSRRLGFVFIAAAPAPGGGGGGCCCWGSVVRSIESFLALPLGYRPRPMFPSSVSFATYDWSAVAE